MMNPSQTIGQIARQTLAVAMALTLVTSCATKNSIFGGEPETDTAIAYPFVAETPAIGKDGPGESFVIKSAVGDKEYSIEIPGAANDYDVQVPIADIGVTDPDVLSGKKSKDTPNPVSTDREMLANMPRIDREHATDTALVDSAFGVGSADGPKQAPSYTLGLAKIKELFKRRQYELALVEVNSLLTFYANSPQLNKMKGTLLLRMHNQPLAEKAWIRALELDPDDRQLRAALDRLQRRMVNSGRAFGPTRPQGPPKGIPAPIGSEPPRDEGVLSSGSKVRP
jgi:hypothetical protein